MYKNFIEGKKAAFFDLDDTLVETAPYWVMAFARVLSGIDKSVDALEVYEPGEPVSDQWKRILLESDIKTQLSVTELTQQTYNQFTQIIKGYDLVMKEGFWPLAFELKIEKEFKLACVTNSTKDTTWQILNKINADKTFDLVLCGDEVKRPKPAPDIYLTAARKLRVKSSQVLVFEDSVSGSKAAAKAKMDMLIVWDGVTEQSKFKGHIFAFLPNFNNLAGNLDKTYMEALEDAAKRKEEFEKNPNQQTETKPQ